MTTSDSEAFESADEDFKDDSSKKTKTVPSTDINVNKKSVEASDSSTPSTKDVVEKKGQAQVEQITAEILSKNEPKDVIGSEDSNSNPGTKDKKRRNQRQSVERKPKQSMKLGVKMDQSDPIRPKTEEAVSDSTKIDALEYADDKSDNDWNDFDVEDDTAKTVADVCPLNISKSDSANLKNANVEPPQVNDGWENDFDDWGNEENQPKSEEKDVKNNNPMPGANEHTEEEYKKLADRLSSLGSEKNVEAAPASSGWGGWGSWGVGNLLSSGVAHVSQGFNMVSNVIETGMGLPDPEDLARSQKEEREKKEAELNRQQRKSDDSPSGIEKEEKADGSRLVRHDSRTNDESIGKGNVESDDGRGVFKLGKLVSSVTKLVESTGTAVVTGGLDTLEEIGKRTMRVLQGEEEGKKRLSTMLKEARARGEHIPPSDYSQSSGNKKKPPQFEALFDDFQGLVYLEALEMLSKQCDMRIQSLLMSCEGRELTELKETLNQVKEICELPDPDDEDDDQASDGQEKLNANIFNDKLMEVTKEMGVKLTFEALVTSCRDVHTDVTEEQTLDDSSKPIDFEEQAEKVGVSAISNLALCSALSVQILHKSTALLAVRERRSTADEADGLTHLTSTLSSYIGDVAAAYSQKLHRISKLCDKPEKINEIITTVFLEAGKGTSYVQDAFLLTIPILQVGAT